ncbi:hypothetical protein VTO42DRAFT_6817 [Malbranchea cinnamomea]
MACPITIAKFVGTISLGLLTGLSYSVSNIAIPALQALPTASNAADTLKDLQQQTRRRVLRFSNLAAVSLIAAFTLSSPRRKHPYLIWTSLAALIGGGGLEWWTTGSFLSMFCSSCSSSRRQASFSGQFGLGAWVTTHLGFKQDSSSNDKKADEEVASNGAASEIEIVEQADAQSPAPSAAPTPAAEEADVNGESVQREMTRERKIQRVRTWILGLGFSMGVVGIWGDGA